MKTPTDAIGYLLNLREEIKHPWFTYLCDQAISTQNGHLSENQSKMLMAIFKGEMEYKSDVKIPQQIKENNNSTDSPFIHLKHLHSFRNFKRLDNNIRLNLSKRVTVIFGANGTGKSSLCSALKVLTIPKEPDTPIENVRELSTEESSFVYQLSDQYEETVWNKSAGYGSLYNYVKYFDSSIAVNILSNSISTEIVSEVTPFKLEVFIHLNSMLNEFKQKIEAERISIAKDIETDINLIKMRLEKYDNTDAQFIKTLELSNIPFLSKMLESKSLTSEEILLQNEEQVQSLMKATSPEGLQLLKKELNDHINFKNKLTLFFDKASELIYDNIPITMQQLHEKKTAQKVFIERYMDQNQNINEFKKFIQTTFRVFEHKHYEGEKCPFCKQILSREAHELILSYREFLTNDLEKEITQLEKDLNTFKNIRENIQSFDISFFDALTSIDQKLTQEAKKIIQTVMKETSIEFEDVKDENIKQYYRFKDLKSIINAIDERISQLYNIILPAEQDQESNHRKIEEIKKKIIDIKFGNELISLKSEILLLHNKYSAYKELENRIGEINFQSISRKITDLSKKAYSELVLSEFQQKLDDEYYKLSEKKASEFGITLTPRSNRAVVQLEPQVGNHTIRKVLSEGEQKVHALALFFTEIYYENKSIIVFDDPVTSLDYNYVASFCERIRDFVIENPQKQIIIFTHDWYFLKDLQKTFNHAGLNQQTYNVQILENCSTITENIEAIDKLKQKIEIILSSSMHFDQEQKDLCAKYLRRLIEAIINVHVFNQTRTQFKRDNIKVSTFTEYTKLTPLLDHEANKLRDLYKKLSPWEHDDPRNIFVNSDKTVFQNRYEEICKIEASILQRK